MLSALCSPLTVCCASCPPRSGPLVLSAVDCQAVFLRLLSCALCVQMCATICCTGTAYAVHFTIWLPATVCSGATAAGGSQAATAGGAAPSAGGDSAARGCRRRRRHPARPEHLPASHRSALCDDLRRTRLQSCTCDAPPLHVIQPSCPHAPSLSLGAASCQAIPTPQAAK